MPKSEKKSVIKHFFARYGNGTLQSAKELIVMRGQKEVTVYGCRRILLYSTQEIRLLAGKKILSVTGKNLFCSCFSAGSVTVEGKVQGVCYLCENAEGNVRTTCK